MDSKKRLVNMKYRLRKEVKNLIYAVVFVAAITGLFAYGQDRFERIDNGEMVVVSQSYRDR